MTFHTIKTSGVQHDKGVLWVTDDSQRIPIVDGKIRFHDVTTNSYFELHVRQIKGFGVADADKLEYLSHKHKMVIQLLLNIGWQKYTVDQILLILQNAHAKNSKPFRMNPYKRTISELFRRGIFFQEDEDKIKPPKYRLNNYKASLCLKTNRFDSNPCSSCGCEANVNSSGDMVCTRCLLLVGVCQCPKIGN